MEIIGRTRQMDDGSTVDDFVVRCEIHDWYFKGLPPITHGCVECWRAYYFAQIALAKGDKQELVNQLESTIKHVVEKVQAGEWDFTPEFKIESIEKDVN